MRRVRLEPPVTLGLSLDAAALVLGRCGGKYVRFDELTSPRGNIMLTGHGGRFDGLGPGRTCCAGAGIGPQ